MSGLLVFGDFGNFGGLLLGLTMCRLVFVLGFGADLCLLW